MSMSRFAAVALAATMSLGSFAGVASARDAKPMHAEAPHKSASKHCRVERVKIRQHGKIVTVKKRVCETLAPSKHHRK